MNVLVWVLVTALGGQGCPGMIFENLYATQQICEQHAGEQNQRNAAGKSGNVAMCEPMLVKTK
jgi:hypothetical protein